MGALFYLIVIMCYNIGNGGALDYYMATSLEEYVAQATNAYKPAQTAIQNQLAGLDSQLGTTEAKINRNYEQQQQQLESQRNQAAEASSLAAAGSGGAFGGQGNIARRKYYEQTFVPAQAQLQTNQANEIEQARQNIENQRTSLNSQLANLEAQANQQALQQYWAEVEAEKQRQAQIAAARASNPYAYLPDGYGNGDNGVKTWDFGNGYKVYDNNGEAVYSLNGNQISRGQFLEGTGKNTQWNLWNDIWNSGTKTNGVGSDTVQAYKNFYQPSAPMRYGNTASLQNSSKYGYLY